MGTLLDLAYNLLVRPRAALREITRGEKLREAGALWLFVILLTSLSSLVEGPGFVTVFALCVLGMGLSLLLHSAVTDYSAGMLGGRGTAKGITAGFMAASLPVAFSVFGEALAILSGGAAGGALGTFLFLWGFALDVIAISENYGFRTGKAFCVALIPLFLFAAVFLTIFILCVVTAVTGLSQFADPGMVEEILQEL